MIKYILLFLMIFIIVLLIYEFILLKNYKTLKRKNSGNRRKINRKDKYPMEVKILRDFYKVDVGKLNYDKLLNFVAVISSIDIALIVMIVSIFRNGIVQILVACVLVLPIIFFSYYLISLYYKYKLRGRKKDE